MKKIITYCFAFSLMIALYAGCSSSSSSNPAGSNGLSMTIGGTAWNLDLPAHAIYASSFNTTSITAANSKGQSMGLSFRIGFSGTGTFKLGDGDTVSGSYGIQSPFKTYDGGNGKVTVTTWTSSHITGTFNFTATNVMDPTDSVVITNGAFDLDITKS